LGILRHELTYEEVIQAEVQHWIRTRAGQVLRRKALDEAQEVSAAIYAELRETYEEECTHDDSGPSHLELVERLITIGGQKIDALHAAVPTPGNAAAMALYAAIGNRGPGCHMLGAGAVEFYYCQLSPRIYEAYTSKYGMSPRQAETYRIHGPMDKEHAERAFRTLHEAVRLHGWSQVEISVRDAFVATSLHYDGMLQAATGRHGYWDGVKR
jgi:hypothetical protein